MRTCLKCEKKQPLSKFASKDNGGYTFNNDYCKSCGFGRTTVKNRLKMYQKLSIIKRKRGEWVFISGKV